MKQRKLFWVLVIAVVLVWGLVAYRFYDALAVADDAQIKNAATSHSIGGRTSDRAFVYHRDLRDPFEFTVEPHAVKASVKAPQTPPWSPPPFQLSGILESKRKRTVTLEDTDGVMYFLSAGDTIRGVKITSVTDTMVTYVYNKRKGRWSLPVGNH